MSKQLKQLIINDALKEFAEPKTFKYKEGNKTKEYTYQETEKSIKEYEKELQKLTYKQLKHLKTIEELKRQHSFMDSIKKLNKKERIVVSIYHSNGTSTDYVTSSSSRVFDIDKKVYIKVDSSAVYDNKHKMLKLCYYENNPFPIIFNNDYQATDGQGKTIPDGILLKKTLKFEYASQLAESKLEKNTNLSMIFSLCSVIGSIINIILLIVLLGHLGVF